MDDEDGINARRSQRIQKCRMPNQTAECRIKLPNAESNCRMPNSNAECRKHKTAECQHANMPKNAECRAFLCLCVCCSLGRAALPSNVHAGPPPLDNGRADAKRASASQRSLGHLGNPAHPVLIPVNPRKPGIPPECCYVHRKVLDIVRFLCEQKKLPAAGDEQRRQRIVRCPGPLQEATCFCGCLLRQPHAVEKMQS